MFSNPWFEEKPAKIAGYMGLGYAGENASGPKVLSSSVVRQGRPAMKVCGLNQQFS
jgi:hypothetical protein